jgi:propionyl-CoA synthetase
VVGVADALKGEIPVGFVVTKAGVDRSDGSSSRQLVERLREHIGPWPPSSSPSWSSACPRRARARSSAAP